jgi:dolichyl-phosphate-mannose--protein O-mannosyl transferase
VPVGIGLCLIVVLLCLTYANSFDNGFHYDDYHSIVENPHIRTLASIPEFFTNPQTFSMLTQRAMFRPLVLSSCALNYYHGQYQANGYRWLNLLVHAACTVLVFALARALGLNPASAGFAAVVFAFHPLQSETVNYISSRSESLAALGYILSLLAFVRFRAAAASADGRWFHALSVVALAIGLMAKSTVATLPAIRPQSPASPLGR